MKQITYAFNLDQLMAAMISTIDDVEDGFYGLSFSLETTPSIIDKLNIQQREGFYPGLITRIVGLEIIRVEDPGPLTLQVLDGMIVTGEIADGFNSNNGGYVESGPSSGTDSGSIGESDPSRGNPRPYPRALPKRPSVLRQVLGRSR